jgi:hypothetical protein
LPPASGQLKGRAITVGVADAAGDEADSTTTDEDGRMMNVSEIGSFTLLMTTSTLAVELELDPATTVTVTIAV